MVSNLLIRKVELGPRQMTFGFEGRMSKIMHSVFSFIKEEYQAGGPVSLDDLISSHRLPDRFDVQDTLQAIFWLAEELKVHFLTQGHISSPRQTKKMLVDSPDSPIFIVINRQAERRKFDQACKIGKIVVPALPEEVNQYTFSRYLVNQLKTWRDRLRSYAPQAKQPFFPGSKEIKNGNVLLDKILEKQDSYSMILSCLKYQSRIVQLAESITVLTAFYNQRRSFWQMFVEQMHAFETNLAEIKKDSHLFAKYRRLYDILNSPQPYALVNEAEQLLTDVKDFHQQIERQKMEMVRSDALVETDKMIKKLISLFDTFESDQQYRNQCLLEFRTLNKRIEKTDHIKDINILLNDAKDLFVDVIEEL